MCNYNGQGVVEREFVIGAPTISSATEPVLYLFSDSDVVEDAQLRVYGKDTIRKAIAVGAGGPDVAPVVSRKATNTGVFPLVERSRTFDTIDSERVLTDIAASAINELSSPRMVPDFAFTANRNDAIVQITPGDLVYLNITSGFVQMETAMRSSEVSITYNSDGIEKAEIGFPRRCSD